MNHADQQSTVPTPLTASDSLVREKSLIKALARAIQIVEMTDIEEAIKIVSELEDDVRLLVGGPIVLHCDPAPIAPLIEEGDVALRTLKQFLAEGGAR